MFRIAALSLALLMAIVAPVFADPPAQEFEVIGTGGFCSQFPGANIVQAAWLTGLGLPDNRMHNFALDDLELDTPNKTDKRYGLLLVKNGSSFDCSSVGSRSAVSSPSSSMNLRRWVMTSSMEATAGSSPRDSKSPG
jgi:hypothetical protein